MDWKSTIVALTRVIEVDGQKVEQITVREPDIEAVEALEELDLPTSQTEAQKIKLRDLRKMAVILTDADDATIRKLHPEDFGTLVETLVPFLEGEASSESTVET